MKKNGFTIIEVILVLAIGGLILTMALITLPGIWRTERDAQRKSDLQIFATRLKEFQTNSNRGALPTGAPTGNSVTTISRADVDGGTDSATTWKGFFRDYFNNTFKDPDGNLYGLKVLTCNSSTSGSNCSNSALGSSLDNYYLYVVVNATCGDDNKATYSANTRRAAILYKLETNDNVCESI